MKLPSLFQTIFITCLLLATGPVFSTMTDEVQELQHEWARIKYQLPAKEQEAAFQQLADKAKEVTASQPGSAEALIWEGIILSTYAGVKGGLGALKLVKQARTLFEQAIATDAEAMQGSAYTSLGSLYYQVPSWPVSFGNDNKALEYLKRGLQLNPDGLDANYFYGDYLLQKGDYAGAEAAFNKALTAPARPGRELADSGRRIEITESLAKIKAQQTVAEKKKSPL